MLGILPAIQIPKNSFAFLGICYSDIQSSIHKIFDHIYKKIYILIQMEK